MNLKLIDKSGQERKLSFAAEFEEAFGVCYLPRLLFKDDRVERVIARKYRRAAKDFAITRKQKFLGQYYAQDLDRESGPAIEIAWVSEEIGYGAFAGEAIAAKTFIGEYTGIVRKWHFFGRWENHYCFDYMIRAGESSSYVIDAKSAGNHTRFINHSFEPNVGLVSVDYRGSIRVILYAKRSIFKGEQLLYDYGEDYWRKRRAPVKL